MIGGAVLQSFSLFMLSLAQQGQFYQVCRLLCIHSMSLTTTEDSSYAKFRIWDSPCVNVRPQHGRHLALFSSTANTRHGARCLWFTNWLYHTLHHVELHLRTDGICQWRTDKCCVCQRSTFHSLLPYADAVRPADKGNKSMGRC